MTFNALGRGAYFALMQYVLRGSALSYSPNIKGDNGVCTIAHYLDGLMRYRILGLSFLLYNLLSVSAVQAGPVHGVYPYSNISLIHSEMVAAKHVHAPWVQRKKTEESFLLMVRQAAHYIDQFAPRYSFSFRQEEKEMGDQDAARHHSRRGQQLTLAEIKRIILPQYRHAEYIGFTYFSRSSLYRFRFVRDEGEVFFVYIDGRTGRHVR